MSEQSLKEKTIKGVGWSALDTFLGQGVSFIVGLVLARLLTPEEYGLIGISLIFITILNSVVDSGFSNALIRKKEICKEDYNTMFITNLVISVVLYLLLYFLAPYISLFFERDITLLVRVLGSTLIINAFTIVQNTILIKKLDFKTKTKSSLISAVISGVIGIVLAFAGYGVWALVINHLVRQVLYAICLWLLSRWKPSIQFNINSYRYLWGYGWKLLVSGLLDTIWKDLYQVVVGKFYSPATLGQYTRARSYAQLLSSNITVVVQRVTFPVLANIQDEKERMIEAYRKVIKVTMFVSCISMFFIAAVSEPLIYCMIGSQWYEASTYLPLICVSMSLYPLHAINLNMLQVQGRSDIFLYLEIIKKLLGIVPLVIGVFYNIYWMLVASIINGIIALFLNTYYTGKRLGYTTWMQIKDIFRDYFIAVMAALLVYFIKYLSLSFWIILPLQFILFFSFVYIVCESIKLEEYTELKNIVISSLRKKHVL